MTFRRSTLTGLLVGVVLLDWAALGWRGEGTWYGLVLIGVIAQVTGTAWDAWSHMSGTESGLAHTVNQTGVLISLLALILATVTSGRASREQIPERSRN